MNQLDYLDENRLRSYPFKDSSSLYCTYASTGIVLPDSIVLDAQVNVSDTNGLTSNHTLSFASLVKSSN